ncbi:uncharacterized protein [Kogia breviceps]|uniref:uncharacterized protein n=1 Tax=Kogia breviceps TaxID=27615 RepID=UPI0034D1E3B1
MQRGAGIWGRCSPRKVAAALEEALPASGRRPGCAEKTGTAQVGRGWRRGDIRGAAAHLALRGPPPGRLPWRSTCSCPPRVQGRGDGSHLSFLQPWCLKVVKPEIFALLSTDTSAQLKFPFCALKYTDCEINKRQLSHLVTLKFSEYFSLQGWTCMVQSAEKEEEELEKDKQISRRVVKYTEVNRKKSVTPQETKLICIPMTRTICITLNQKHLHHHQPPTRSGKELHHVQLSPVGKKEQGWVTFSLRLPPSFPLQLSWFLLPYPTF